LLLASPDLPADLMAVPFAVLAFVTVSLFTQRRTPPKPLLDEKGDVVNFSRRVGTDIFYKDQP